MIRVDASHESARYCDGLSRRSFVQLGVAGMASVGLGDVLRAKAASKAGGHASKDTSVILIWLDGGPGHMDMYDMKPDAPADYRGIWRPIRSNVTGMEMTELFPRQAKIADKFSIVRSFYHNNGDHFTGAHYMLTGRGGVSGANTKGRFPSIGSIATWAAGSRDPSMPAYVSVPFAGSVGLRPGYFAANFLGVHHDPFITGGDPNSNQFQVHNLNLPSRMSIARLEDRHALNANLDRMERVADSRAFDSLDEFDRKAYQLVVGSAARKAFDLSREDPRTRDRYGRNTWGQSTLLARRLVEAGSTFVTVHYGGWDHHWNLEGGMNNFLPKVDSAVSALFEDLSQSGRLENVLVIMCGEFGRTPRMNNGHDGQGTPGRDHWGRAMFVLMGGGGVQGGRIIGSTNHLGEEPKDHPLTMGDFHATIYHVLGIDPHISFLDHSGRPVHAVEQGEPIRELF